MLYVPSGVSDPLVSGLAFMALFAVVVLVTFADERKHARRFYGDGNE